MKYPKPFSHRKKEPDTHQASPLADSLALGAPSHDEGWQLLTTSTDMLRLTAIKPKNDLTAFLTFGKRLESGILAMESDRNGTEI